MQRAAFVTGSCQQKFLLFQKKWLFPLFNKFFTLKLITFSAIITIVYFLYKKILKMNYKPFFSFRTSFWFCFRVGSAALGVYKPADCRIIHHFRFGSYFRLISPYRVYWGPIGLPIDGDII